MSFLKGQIVRIIADGPYKDKRGLVLGEAARGYIQVSEKFRNWYSMGFKLEDLELAEPKSKRGGYDLDEDFGPIITGLRDLPNWEEITDPLAGIDAIAAGGGLRPVHEVCHIRMPMATHTRWGRLFLSTTQGGGLDGTGYAMIYGGSNWNLPEGERGTGRIGRFAICQHKKVDGPGANHSRGWHPGNCSICGLDMTVDSGD